MTELSTPVATTSTPPLSLTSGQLPRFIEPIVLGVSLAVIAALQLVLGGFNVATWLIFSALVYLLAIGVFSAIVEGRRKSTDRVVRGLVTAAFVLAVAPLISTLWTVVSKGMGVMSWDFVTKVGGTTFDPDTLAVVSTPGALQAIVGTLIITGIAALISVPIGILAAVYLVEYAQPNNPLRRAITFLVDVMTGIPSIVAGLFAFSLFALIVGPKAFSGFSASIALCVLMIPIVIRSTEEMLRLVPADLREASFALGVPRSTTIIKVVLRTAASGIITGVVLAVARVIGETAPIFIAASFTDNFNSDPFNGPMQTLPVMAYTAYSFPGQDIDASQAQAWGAALLLVILVVIFNLIARIVAKVFAPKAR
ncbi:phosphate ABC transporter permease PstA [Microbacterium hominis]|uniref:phosphate ABC transporter permease PstA n=1 Tax=Microbacterium TaxID=33882 RepID=UPI00168A90EA|nr:MULTISPECIES: phosphate ABC transporter permease PstA [Microbacterium]QOC24750.1 phosphate ABC transporter permease PstA [Microbacterium hominis]QOC28805.1 phosphate ABC transporter permease PstA [Microbacterium hominis]QYF98974.1 phosphate ABC transporter permease PstA [Microbacterium sp. PAMC21962]